ncbi:rhodanese-like domain-containing protein [Poseidonibacter lekithochrous]|uniref:rhodanese-like domain-containing protein n=1 Tax=Poseidonibacter lekithochrous TaxID=1904463 RepID=UPI0009FAEB98|nr:rhodanese-like domain-containing protein [Poseidonibacter lekithochrous]QKJ23585.1 rhodanese-like domain-containing protein [Poseidonibacter lekithochrous]
MNKKLLLTLVLLFTAIFVNAQEVNFQTAMFYKADIDSKEAYKMQQEGALLIDVRTKREFVHSRAKGSILIPLFYEKNRKRVFNKEFLNQVYKQVNKNLNKTIVLICRSGSRTKLAANLLSYNGFKDIYNIKKGFQYDWSKTNLPVEKN